MVHFAVGPPVSGSIDRAVVEAYHAHDVLLALSLIQMVTIVGFLVFLTAPRETVVRHEAAALPANVGFACAIVAAALLLVRTALRMATVRAVDAGIDELPTYFAWDFTYNTAVYAMEAS